MPTDLPDDLLRLEVRDIEVSLLTGILSEETKLPQPLRISVIADLAIRDRFLPTTPLSASKNYLDLKRAVTEGIPRDVHFGLIEAIADHVAETLFLQDGRVTRVEVTIVKLAISLGGESIGLTMVRHAANIR